MKREDLYLLLGKYFADEIEEEEKALVEKWKLSSDQNAKEFEMHKRAWENTQVHFSAPDPELVFKKILNKIDDQQELDFTKKAGYVNKNRQGKISLYAKIAASLLLIMALGYYFFIVQPNPTAPSLATAIVQKQNLAGQKSKIYLPDGTSVWLNAESKLSFPEQFLKQNREVYLEGEAFFDVIKNPNQPFIVHTGNVSTMALGTSFNIKAFLDEPTTYVALKTGKVKVSIAKDGAGEDLFLNPGEGVRYDKNHQKSVKHSIDKESFFSWKDGIIVFEDAHMKEVIGTLSRWYGVKFEIENRAQEDWSYTGSFDNVALENVLRSMSFTKDFSYSINQKNVQIKFN